MSTLPPQPTDLSLVRKVSLGLRFEKGWEFYRIADLSRVWVLADVYEREAECFQPGVAAEVILPYQKKTFRATVSKVLPVYDKGTRTLKVRLELDNPGFVLRPDMLVDVQLPVTYPEMLTVPEGAVLNSGSEKDRFRRPGQWLLRTAPGGNGPAYRQPDRNCPGLEAGEKIALSGNFLIDSESKMELAASGMYDGLAKDPVSDLDVSVNKALKAGRSSIYKGETYYFASDAVQGAV